MPESKDKSCTMCSKFGIKPLTKNNLVFYYAPALGAVNFAVLSVNVMNPSLISRIFPSRDVTNILLAHSMIGSALYIYNRPHLHGAPQQLRILYSGYNSLMFNFGSVLLWAVLKSVSPKSACVSTIFGLLATGGLIYSGQKCLEFLDSRLPSKST